MGRPKTVSKTIEEKTKRKRELERKRYQKIKENPVLYAQYQQKNKAKYEKRKVEKKVVSIKDMTPRARKMQRKKWREAFNAYYKRKKDAKAAAVKFMQSQTPPDSEAEDNNELQRRENSSSPSILANFSTLSILIGNKENTNPNSRIRRSQESPLSDCKSDSHISKKSLVSSRENSPSQSIRKLRYKKDKEIQALTRHLEGVKKINEAYRKKIERLTKEKEGSSVDIMNDKLVQSYKALNTHYAKQEFSRSLETNVKTTLKDKRCLGKLTNIFRRRLNEQKGSKVKKIREDIKKFLEEDENSSVTAGKKETIKKAGVIKQKRYMTNSLYHLHRKFLTKVQYKLSFTTFSRFRPFWILFSSQKPKETCLCITHENFGLLVEAIHRNHIIPHKNATDVLSDICCDPFNANCLLRVCKDCRTKYISNFEEFNDSVDFNYWSWVSKREQVVQNGKEKFIRVVKKDKIVIRPRDAIHLFQKQLDHFSKHCGRVLIQHIAIKTLKDSLQAEEAIIHIDFSENYKCQYSKEIQAVHFGGNRKQVTLHTGVLYFFDSDYTRITQSFATLSQNLRHDAAAVWAHVVPILEYLKEKAPQIKTLHFVSDSATSQYRNFKMFFVICALKWQYPSLNSLTWNYTESGHGKGAPDGVGGTLKRTADAIVSRGVDIPDFDTFVEELKSNVKNVLIKTVSDYDIIEKDMLLPTDLRSFKGTQQVHQVIWNVSDKYQVTMRNLSCVNKTCVIKPRYCCHVKHLGSHLVKPEMSNSSNPDLSITISSVVSLQRSYAFCAMTETDLPEELRPEIATVASDVRPERKIVRRRGKSPTIVQKYSQDAIKKLPKTKNQRRIYGETSSDDEMTMLKSPESDLYNIEDETIDKSKTEEHDNCIDADEDNVHEGDWVVVKFVSEKNIIHRYVGQVVNESLASLDIKFAKKINDRRFKWPENPDISVIGKYQVVKKLSPPKFKSSSNRIGAFEFNKSLKQMKIDF